MNETLKQSFEQRSFIDNLPEASLDVRNTLTATGLSAVALVGIVGANAVKPEKADAVSEACTAPSGEVSTQTKPNIQGRDLATDTIAISSSKVCENVQTEAKTSIRNTGSEMSTFVEFFIEGNNSVVNSVESVNISSETWPVVPMINSSKMEKVCEIDKYGTQDRDGKGASPYIVCSRRWGITLMPGETAPVSFNFHTSASALNNGSGGYLRVRTRNIRIVDGKYIKTEYPNTEQTKPFDLWDYAGTQVVKKSQARGWAEGGNGSYDINAPNTAKCTPPTVNMLYSTKNKTIEFAVKSNAGKISGTGNGADKSPAKRAKAARALFNINKNLKIKNMTPQLARDVRKVTVDVPAKGIGKNYWIRKISLNKLNKSDMDKYGKFFVPKGTMSGCNKDMTVYAKLIDKDARKN